MTEFRRATHLSIATLVLACGNDLESDFDVASKEQLFDSSERPALVVAISQEDGEPVANEFAIQESTAPISAEEYAAWDELRLSRGAEMNTEPPESSSTELALDFAAGRAPDELVPLMIMLDNPSFDFEQFAEAKSLPSDQADAQRAALVAQRQQQVSEAGQAAVIDRLRALGVEVDLSFWLFNGVAAQVPARLVPTLAGWTEVKALEYLDPADAPVPDADGADVRDDTFVGNLLDDGFNASDGHFGGTARVRIGLIETSTNNGLVARNHPVFLDTAGGATRFQSVYNCNPGCATTVANGAGTEHGTRVAWVASGNIMGGIDPNFTGADTLDQRRRSGVAQEGWLYYYFITGSAGFAAALQQAVTDGIDVANASMSFAAECATSIPDPRTYDLSSINAAITAAMPAGTLFAKSAGNSHSAGETCSIGYPGWRAEALTVGSIDTTTTTTLENGFLAIDSSRGLSRVGYENGAFTEGCRSFGTAMISTI